MTNPVTTKSLPEALSRFQQAVGEITKDARGQHSDYATLPHVLGFINPALRANDLVLSQPYELVDGVNVLTTVVTHIPTGEKLVSRYQPVKISGGKNPIHVEGSGMTYFRRYTMLSLLGLAPGIKDDDGELGEFERPTSEKVTALKAVTIAEHELNEISRRSIHPEKASEADIQYCLTMMREMSKKDPNRFADLRDAFTAQFGLGQDMVPSDIRNEQHVSFIELFLSHEP